jgi:dimethylhistidine N-methyltransferase
MTTIGLPQLRTLVSEQIASAVSEGLMSRRKWLPSWLFYDAVGSELFNQITELPEYYLTRTERGILAAHAEEIIGLAADCDAVRLVELGAGSADKTRLLLSAAVDRQDTVFYEPVDVSASALEEAQERIELEIPGVLVTPRVEDYTRKLELDAAGLGERRLVLYIGSSIGNFEPDEAERLLKNVRGALSAGDSMLLGVDLVKSEGTLLAAYDDAAGVTAAFNLNLLARLNRELGSDFELEAFAHRAVWNAAKSRIEMHLMSRRRQRVKIPSLDLKIDLALRETIHTENSYKYLPGQAEALLARTGFTPTATWTDEQERFAVCLATAGESNTTEQGR